MTQGPTVRGGGQNWNSSLILLSTILQGPPPKGEENPTLHSSGGVGVCGSGSRGSWLPVRAVGFTSAPEGRGFPGPTACSSRARWLRRAWAGGRPSSSCSKASRNRSSFWQDSWSSAWACSRDTGGGQGVHAVGHDGLGQPPPPEQSPPPTACFLFTSPQPPGGSLSGTTQGAARSIRPQPGPCGPVSSGHLAASRRSWRPRPQPPQCAVGAAALLPAAQGLGEQVTLSLSPYTVLHSLPPCEASPGSGDPLASRLLIFMRSRATFSWLSRSICWAAARSFLSYRDITRAREARAGPEPTPPCRHQSRAPILHSKVKLQGKGGGQSPLHQGSKG